MFLDGFGCGMYYNVFVCVKTFFLCPCVAINVRVQCNGVLLPDIILLTQSYYHLGFSPLYGNKCSEGLDTFRFFFKNKRLICLYRTK